MSLIYGWNIKRKALADNTFYTHSLLIAISTSSTYSSVPQQEKTIPQLYSPSSPLSIATLLVKDPPPTENFDHSNQVGGDCVVKYYLGLNYTTTIPLLLTCNFAKCFLDDDSNDHQQEQDPARNGSIEARPCDSTAPPTIRVPTHFMCNKLAHFKVFKLTLAVSSIPHARKLRP